jgi:hypothetical protein
VASDLRTAEDRCGPDGRSGNGERCVCGDFGGCRCGDVDIGIG